MINRILALLFLLLISLACHKNQALLQHGVTSEIEHKPTANQQIDFLSEITPQIHREKHKTDVQITKDTIDIKADTILPPVKEKPITPLDTLSPKISAIDSITIRKDDPIIQAKADKMAKQSYNLGFAAIVLAFVFWPLSLISAGFAFSLGKKALKLGTKTPKKANDGIKMAKISALAFLILTILYILLLILFFVALANAFVY